MIYCRLWRAVHVEICSEEHPSHPFFWLYLDLLMRYPTVFVSIVLLFLAKALESHLLSGLFNLYETQMSYKLI